MELSLLYQGKPLFSKSSEKLIKEKYLQMSKYRLPESSSIFANYSGIISVKDLERFKRAYRLEMGKFKRDKKIIGYDIPSPEISVQKRIARVFLNFSKSSYGLSFAGESWQKQQILQPIAEYDRRISFAKAKSILKKFER